MAFWLVHKRHGQHEDYIQRFDPRFWTVNFPRPMMASVIANGPDKMRVTCEFQHRGELCGLIWESADTLDHPLLAYRTDRNYSHTTLSFSWKSSGVMALDKPNGPTLTIEGRDAAGAARVWYVRLWNYASGTPNNATITLPFSKLSSGWALPGEPVYPADIDRMFISLVPPNFQPGSTTPLAATQTGTVTIKDIRCDGERAMVPIGDVILPPHDVQMATAYDDSYNQTPERLVRNILALGYRGRILHYVGMSHFFALQRTGSSLLAKSDGAICLPAGLWHAQFLMACKEAGYEVILSLSYELFAQHCPPAWQQLAHDGEPARTGWVPPSALLSPANSNAMGWLRSVATNFVSLQLGVGLPVLFQIGEPWWWVTPGGKPCLYDAAAVATFGGAPPVISSMTEPLDAAQQALLDQAGVVLAQSTIDLANAVRTASGGAAEIMLLAFTPTILDPEMPDIKRANVPLGWAWPAFDRLQLEDYDWLTAGADGRRRSAYREFAERLGYPVEKQDYLAGFVLDPADSNRFWPHIDQALDEASDRGIAQRFVWALPQVTRDGYVRMAPVQDDDTMNAFDDVLYPLPLGHDTAVSPQFLTSVSVTASGHERRNSQWQDARLRFDVGPGIRSEAELTTLIAFFRARRGAARGFRIADPFDFSSNAMTGQPGPADQLLAIADGNEATFQLSKRYGDVAEAQFRPITRPRIDTIRVSIDGAETSAWSHLGKGRIALNETPAAGAEIRAGFLFDVPVRFAEDRLDVSGAQFKAGEAPSVPLIEIRESE